MVDCINRLAEKTEIPIRKIGPALFVGGVAIKQLWLFWVAPVLGGVLGGAAYRWLSEGPSAPVVGTKTPT